MSDIIESRRYKVSERMQRPDPKRGIEEAGYIVDFSPVEYDEDEYFEVPRKLTLSVRLRKFDTEGGRKPENPIKGYVACEPPIYRVYTEEGIHFLQPFVDKIDTFPPIAQTDTIIYGDLATLNLGDVIDGLRSQGHTIDIDHSLQQHLLWE